MAHDFKDHFSGHANAYTRYRPSYPLALFADLAALPAKRERAWDCATGGGQAAQLLAAHFKDVFATDASASQVAHAQAYEGVSYAVAPAENSGLAAGSIDLINVAQAVHWFDIEAFYTEVRRVAAADAVLALITYGLFSVNAEVDPLIKHFYSETVGPYWPKERHLIDAQYQTLPFPFPELEMAQYTIETDWDLDHLIGYLGTWSAVARYRKSHGSDPLASMEEKLVSAWAAPRTSAHTISWPVYLRVGRVV